MSMKKFNGNIRNQTRELPASLLRTGLCRKDSRIALDALQILWTKSEKFVLCRLPTFRGVGPVLLIWSLWNGILTIKMNTSQWT